MKSNLTLILRQLKRNKVYSIVNIIGLAVGLSTCFIIFVYVEYQTNFDRYNKKVDSIFLIYTERTGVKNIEQATPLILGPTLKEQYPEVVEYSRWKNVEAKFEVGEKHFSEDIIFADPSIFNILTLPIINGSAVEYGRGTNSIIISRRAAKKFFGEDNPINKELTFIYKDHPYLVKVVAIMDDIPNSSTFVTDFIAPMRIFESAWNQHRANLTAAHLFSDWSFNNVNTYLLLSRNADIREFKEKLYQFSILPEHRLGVEKAIYHIMPITDIYFNASIFYDNSFPTGSRLNTFIYSTLAAICLLISLLTFLMMNSGRTLLRTREVSVKKVLGASGINLLIQNIIESLSITFLALPISILLVELFLPTVSQSIGQRIASDYFHNWKIIFVFWLTAFIIGGISGGFISYYYSQINPIDVFRNKIILGSNKKILRGILIVIQLSISAALIFSSIIIFKQLDYFINKDFGYKKEGLLFLYPNNKSIDQHFKSFKTELKKNSEISGVTGGMSLPGSNTISAISYIPNKVDPSRLVETENFYISDDDFIETMGLEMKTGKSFKQFSINDSSKVCIINETAMNQLSFKNPIGEKIDGAKIIGVVKDFNAHSLYTKIKPTVIMWNTGITKEIAVRIRDNATFASNIEFIKKVSSAYNNNTPMQYQFLEDRLGELYQGEHNFLHIMEFFTISTVIVICMGLFGMSSFIINQRKREVGVRKVLGASFMDIIYTLSKEFLILTTIATLIAFSVSYYFLNNWLNNFYYRINIGIMSYIISCIIVLLVVILTISYNAIKLAKTETTDILRNE